MGEDKGSTPVEQKTLIGPIKARLERNEKGAVEWVPDPQGPWKIITQPPTSGLVCYFTPAYQEGYDEFGQPLK